MKFEIKILHDIKEVINFDDGNSNTYWEDSINKERENVKIS